MTFIIIFIWTLTAFAQECRGQITVTQSPSITAEQPGGTVNIKCKTSSDVQRWSNGNEGLAWTMIIDAEKVKTRWKQYLEDLYNDPNPVDERILANLDYNGDEEPTPSIMMEEVVRAIDRLKTRKAPGIDNITAEEIKAATDGTGLQIIFQLCK
ncbi:unnamed protein product [Leuciscus chuanchicus]